MGNLNSVDLIFLFPPHSDGQIILRMWPTCFVKFLPYSPTWVISSSMPVTTIQVDGTIATTPNGWHSSTYSPLWRRCMYLGGWQARLLLYSKTSLGRWSLKCYHPCTYSC